MVFFNIYPTYDEYVLWKQPLSGIYSIGSVYNCRKHIFPLVFPSYLIRGQMDLIRAEDLNLINAILTK